MDNISKNERSRIMGLVRNRNTGPEMKVRSFLHSHGLRFRTNDKRFPGKPDLVFPMYKTVVFVHGCFWHGHNSPKCKLARVPKTRVNFWEGKIKSNYERDARNSSAIKSSGWRVLLIWECELSNMKALMKLFANIRKGSI